MKMITPGIADSMTPHGWYDAKEPRARRSRLLAGRVHLPHLRLYVPHLHLPHLRPRHPQG